MQVTKMPEQKRFAIVESAKHGLEAPWAEKRPGFCQRWVRQVLHNAGVPTELQTLGSPDARTSFRMYEEKGCVMPVGTKPQIGDLLYWIGDGHGRHGHVGIKSTPTHFNENSSVHAESELGDARGYRLLKSCPGYRVVRLWA